MNARVLSSTGILSISSCALVSISSWSKAVISSLVICFKFLPPENSNNLSFSLSVICFSKRINRFANDKNKSSSATPIVTAPNKSFIGTEGLRSKGLLSVFLDLVAPTASTITKWVLLLAVLVTSCKESLFIVRVPRPFICSK